MHLAMAFTKATGYWGRQTRKQVVMMHGMGVPGNSPHLRPWGSAGKEGGLWRHGV